MAIFLTLPFTGCSREVDQDLASAGGNPRRADGDAILPQHLNDTAALLFARGADFLSAFDKRSATPSSWVFLRDAWPGILANEYLGTLAVSLRLLVYRSRFLPRILGVWLMLNCFAYLATSVTGIVWPQYEERVLQLGFPGDVRRTRHHAVAHLHGCEGAAAAGSAA